MANSELGCAGCDCLFADEKAFDTHQHQVIECRMAEDQYQAVEYPDRIVYRLRGKDEPAVVKAFRLDG